MRRILIFSQSATGHYLEYLHHLYMAAINHPDTEFVFCVPEVFNAQKHLWTWPEAKNITMAIESDKVLSYEGGTLRRNFRFARTLVRAVRTYQTESVLLLSLMMVMPWLIFLMPSHVKVSGIVYGIDFYRWKNLDFLQKAFAVLNYGLLACKKNFSHVYLLNAPGAARFCNRKFHTEHFASLPDPFCEPEAAAADFRKQYGIPAGKKVLLHFGAMGAKKGTFLILETILRMSEEELEPYTFVFAGCLWSNLKRFQEYQQKIQDKAHILLFNEFCSYEQLSGWCKACDAILAPYLSSYSSSGMPGYAAYFRKPLLTVDNGMLARIVRKYGLGICIAKAEPDCLKHGFASAVDFSVEDDSYLQINNVSCFTEQILNDAAADN